MTKMLSNFCYYFGAVSIPISILLWFLVKGEDKSSGERWGIFVGLWAPTLMICGKVLEDRAIADKK